MVVQQVPSPPPSPRGEHEAPHRRAGLAQEGRGHVCELAVDTHAGEAGHDDDRRLGEVMWGLMDRVSDSLLAVRNAGRSGRLPEPGAA